MRGHGSRSIIADNLNAVNPSLVTEKAMVNKHKMCWKCQKPKSTVGGHIKLYPGLMKFICKDCMQAKSKTT